jgi:hypothetical protein
LNSVPGRVGEVIKEEVHSILSRNPGCERGCEIEEILASKRTELPSKKYQLLYMLFVPVRRKDVFPTIRTSYKTGDG